MLVSLLLFACSTTPGPGPTAQVAQTPVAEQPDGEAERMQLTLNPRYLSYDEEAGTVTFSPDSDRMSASYTHYVISLDNLEEVLGGRPEAEVTVTFEIGGKKERNTVPDDPNLPQPEGGFNNTTWIGRIIAAE